MNAKEKERSSSKSEDVVELLPKSSPSGQEKNWESGSDDEVVYDSSKL